MKISELREALDEAERIHGDITVVISTEAQSQDGGQWSIAAAAVFNCWLGAEFRIELGKPR